MRPTFGIRLYVLFIFTFSFALALSAQDSNPSLGDLARQQREQRQKQSGNPGQPDASETSGLKEADFKANVLITDSHDAIEKWVLTPEADRAGTGRIRQVTTGKKYYLPFVVTGYKWPASERMTLIAHVRLISPDGKTQFDAPAFSRTIAADLRSPSVIVLNPVMDYTLDLSDLPGTYTVRVTIMDRVHSEYAKAEEQFQLIQGTNAEREAEKTTATVSQTKP